MRKFSLLLAAVLTVIGAGHASAGVDLIIANDQAKMLAVSGTPGTVVVGNPSIADVTVQGTNIFVHGRNFGSTNVLVLDRDGNELAALDVTVMKGGNHNVSVFRAASRYSYTCTPDCEAAPEVGDNVTWYKDQMENNKTKGAIATGAEKAGD